MPHGQQRGGWREGVYFKHVSQYVDVTGRGGATEEKTLPPLVLLNKRDEKERKPIRARSKKQEQSRHFYSLFFSLFSFCSAFRRSQRVN